MFRRQWLDRAVSSVQGFVGLFAPRVLAYWPQGSAWIRGGVIGACLGLLTAVFFALISGSDTLLLTLSASFVFLPTYCAVWSGSYSHRYALGLVKGVRSVAKQPASRGLAGQAVGLVIALAVTTLVSLFAADYWILWRGDCRQPSHYRIATLNGRVVGKSLRPIQYRWLRRQFAATGAVLVLSTEHYENRPGAGLIPTGTLVREITIDKSGTFDFGALSPDDYVLQVTLPGENTVEFHVTVDSAAQNSRVLIDASPAYYCACCGWDFEPQ